LSTTNYDSTTQTARDYYNSDDADTFYAEVWGGEDIHVGLYKSADEPISDASRRTVDHLIDRLGDVKPEDTVLDIGAGYGGAARRMVERLGCKVICLNLSEAENNRNREMNQAAGVEDRIKVIDGSFEDVPIEDNSVEFAWSQDAILHASDRAKVLAEVDRVLKPGGRFVFTDPMQADDCPDGVLDPILARIHLSSLGSPGFYKGEAEKLGWKDQGFELMTDQLARHYTRVFETTEAQADKLSGKISDDYIERMKKGLRHWIDGGNSGHLAWGVFCFEKP